MMESYSIGQGESQKFEKSRLVNSDQNIESIPFIELPQIVSSCAARSMFSGKTSAVRGAAEERRRFAFTSPSGSIIDESGELRFAFSRVARRSSSLIPLTTSSALDALWNPLLNSERACWHTSRSFQAEFFSDGSTDSHALSTWTRLAVKMRCTACILMRRRPYRRRYICSSFEIDRAESVHDVRPTSGSLKATSGIVVMVAAKKGR